jgi:catechol 2,3-dioxygenase-like lactoylglutathione lyase family enzyme
LITRQPEELIMPANTAPTAATSRRAGVLAVHSVDHVSFAVPDLAQAKQFYEAFGLDVKPAGGGLELYAAGRPQHCWMKIAAGPGKRLSYVSFGIFADDLPRFREKLTRAELLSAPPPGVQPTDSLWLRDPHGVAIELRVAEKCTPDDKTISERKSTPAGVVASYSRSKAAKVRPERLSHIALYTPSVPRSVAFYRETLGIRLSDSSLDIVAFMHGAHGSDHHMIAFVKSNGPGLHHVSWAVGSLDEVGLGAAQMQAAGHRRGWGTGRHILGSNYFYYVRDPWGSHCEYSFDIDYVPATMDWQSGEHAPEDALYLWGPDLPEDFMNNTEVTA